MKGFIKWALFIFLVNAVLMLVGYLTMDENSMKPGEGGLGQALYYLGMVVGLVFLFLGIREKKMSDPSEFTFGKGFTEGLLISVLAGLFIGLFSYLFYTLVAPEVIDMIRESSYAAMEEQGTSAEQIEQARPMMDFFISPAGFFVTMLIMYTIGGLVLSLIMSAIVNAMGPKSGGNEPVTA
jgi:hypothetical protein